MLRDNLAGLIEPMLSSAGTYSLALCTHPNESSDDRPQNALKIPARQGGIYTLPENVASPFHAEPAHENIWMPNDLRQQSVFDAWFSRCHEMLHFLACRVLGSPERADDVVENCRITASQNPPTFESEGAFRSWLVRILIDEALVIVRQRERTM